MTMATDRLETLLSNEQLLPLSPVLYIACADIRLTDTERERVRELAEALPEFGAESKATLDAWLHPGQPPTASEMARLRHHIRELAGKRQATLAAIAAAMKSGVNENLTDAVSA